MLEIEVMGTEPIIVGTRHLPMGVVEIHSQWSRKALTALTVSRGDGAGTGRDHRWIQGHGSRLYKTLAGEEPAL